MFIVYLSFISINRMYSSDLLIDCLFIIHFVINLPIFCLSIFLYIHIEYIEMIYKLMNCYQFLKFICLPIYLSISIYYLLSIIYLFLCLPSYTYIECMELICFLIEELLSIHLSINLYLCTIHSFISTHYLYLSTIYSLNLLSIYVCLLSIFIYLYL